jgi:DNA-binding response OmpR family regulator
MGAKTILLADDRTRRLAPIAASLRDAGFTVLTADDAQHAWRLAAQASPDLLITNYVLKDSSGVELCQGLRRDARTAQLPAILMTAAGYSLDSSIPAKVGIRRIIPNSARAVDVVASANDLLRRAA